MITLRHQTVPTSGDCVFIDRQAFYCIGLLGGVTPHNKGELTSLVQWGPRCGEDDVCIYVFVAQFKVGYFGDWWISGPQSDVGSSE